ncbi:MAG: hypothetical protein H0X25_05445 [Acidobacteriales bacterium]|nr:hypothetical protein [Terriglobales bacterium]
MFKQSEEVNASADYLQAEVELSRQEREPTQQELGRLESPLTALEEIGSQEESDGPKDVIDVEVVVDRSLNSIYVCCF